jgi:hypothetical protein
MPGMGVSSESIGFDLNESLFKWIWRFEIQSNLSTTATLGTPKYWL